MSEQPGAEDGPTGLEITSGGDVAFGALMDVLVAEEAATGGAPAGADSAGGGAGAASGGAAAGVAGAPPVPAADPAAGTPAVGAGGAGQQPADAGAAAPGTGDGAPGSDAGAADSGSAGTAESGGGDAGGSAEGSAGSTHPDAARLGFADLDDKAVGERLGQLSTTIEQNVSKAFQQEAYGEVQSEYKAYFDALEKHPRLLVGTQVPKIGGAEGEMEALKSSDDAREWQEAVKSILVPEIQARAQTKLEGSRDYLETLHSSVELFLKNRDLLPGTPGFNRQLADAFAQLATPYEVRVDGKLRGYSIPVQPLIENLRKQQAVTPVPPSAPAAAAEGSAGSPSSSPADPPQAGIQSKAGSSAGQKEDFSTLFGTIGLPNIKI